MGTKRAVGRRFGVAKPPLARCPLCHPPSTPRGNCQLPFDAGNTLSGSSRKPLRRLAPDGYPCSKDQSDPAPIAIIGEETPEGTPPCSVSQRKMGFDRLRVSLRRNPI
jgi:hypothetical protein